jgi:hypothetical protein
MTRTYSSLHVASLDAEAHERTCGYWYTVTDHAIAHTAFATRAGLDRWLKERGLHLERELPAHGEIGHSRIVGTYRERSYLHDANELEAVRPLIATAIMSNADYTLGLIDEDEAGTRTVHYLNPNVKTRLVFDYQRTRQEMN